MFKLDSGAVLLKPSHRRQLMTWIKRAIRIGERSNNFSLSISMTRIGRLVEVQADVAQGRNTARFRSRKPDWRDAARELSKAVTLHLHDSQFHRLSAA
jgi:hypothetical protein